MNFDALVEELTVRVMTALSNPTDKGVLLLLPQEQNPACLPTPCEGDVNKGLLEPAYRLLCARTIAYEPDWNQIAGVVAFGLTIGSLGKIAMGLTDGLYETAMSQAILRGKPVFIPECQVELLQYENKVPSPYFLKLRENLLLLEQSGLRICSTGRLEEEVLKGGVNVNTKLPDSICLRRMGQAPFLAPAAVPASAPILDELVLTKHLITEQDLMEAGRAGTRRVTIGTRAILTDLARDFAQKQGIEILRGQ